MDKLIRAWENMVGRTLHPNVREPLKRWGVMEPDWEQRDQDHTPRAKLQTRIRAARPEGTEDIMPEPRGERGSKEEVMAQKLRDLGSI